MIRFIILEFQVNSQANILNILQSWKAAYAFRVVSRPVAQLFSNKLFIGSHRPPSTLAGLCELLFTDWSLPEVGFEGCFNYRKARFYTYSLC